MTPPANAASRHVARATALVAALGVSATLGALALHEQARGAWERERARIGSPEYDAAQSDASWDASSTWRTTASRVGLLGALALVIAAAASRPRATDPAPPPPAARPSRARLLGSTALDGALLASALVLAPWLRALPRSPALADALAVWAPALALALFAAMLARGATPGMRALGLRAADARAPRILVATALAPLSIVWLLLAPLLAVTRVARPGVLAPHLALAGIAVAGRAPRG